MSKNLKEMLKTLDSEAIVAIGTEEGSGFMYIGEAGDMETIEECFSKYLANIRKKLSNHKGMINNLVATVPDKGMSQDETFSIALRYARTITNEVKAYDYCVSYIDTYVPAMERVVKETYHKNVDNCTAIIIKGLETGGYWLQSEFGKRKKK